MGLKPPRFSIQRLGQLARLTPVLLVLVISAILIAALILQTGGSALAPAAVIILAAAAASASLMWLQGMAIEDGRLQVYHRIARKLGLSGDQTPQSILAALNRLRMSHDHLVESRVRDETLLGQLTGVIEAERRQSEAAIAGMRADIDRTRKALDALADGRPRIRLAETAALSTSFNRLTSGLDRLERELSALHGCLGHETTPDNLFELVPAIADARDRLLAEPPAQVESRFINQVVSFNSGLRADANALRFLLSGKGSDTGLQFTVRTPLATQAYLASSRKRLAGLQATLNQRLAQ